MKLLFKKRIKTWLKKRLVSLFPELDFVKNKLDKLTSDTFNNSKKGEFVKISEPYLIANTTIGDYTYFNKNCLVTNTDIGKFCSIGRNIVCGNGIHPIDGVSTSPMFYSTLKQNGVSLVEINKIEERKRITIGNDVFIGANVTILDGVEIGDGAVIGAGAVVSKNIPDYAVAVGCPIKIIKYRFDNETILKLKKIKWWDFSFDELKNIEQNFFNVEEIISKYYNN